jgi:L-rhamnose mutarotase
MTITRIGQVIKLRPEKREEYLRLHADVWPEVLRAIAAANIRNYSIFLREPELLMFGTYEYHGSDYAADMARMAADEAVQRWWKITDACQERLPSAEPGEWWAPMQLAFFRA